MFTPGTGGDNAASVVLTVGIVDIAETSVVESRVDVELDINEDTCFVEEMCSAVELFTPAVVVRDTSVIGLSLELSIGRFEVNKDGNEKIGLVNTVDPLDIPLNVVGNDVDGLV